MATVRAITILNQHVPAALEAVERVWKSDAERVAGGESQYALLTAPDKIRACLIAMVRVSTRNAEREKAERAVALPPEPDVV